MKMIAGTVAAASVTAVLIALSATPSAAGERARGPSNSYDGLWSVSIRTQAGPCDPSYRYPARISGGQIQQAINDFSYQISGNVIASGAVAVSISKGLGTAVGYGRLRGGSGSGRWNANNNTCIGTWSATRRGA
jgi:hypothetical protein